MEKLNKLVDMFKGNWREIFTGIIIVLLALTFVLDETTGLISGAFLCCIKYLCLNSVPTNLTIQCSELIIKDKNAN